MFDKIKAAFIAVLRLFALNEKYEYTFTIETRTNKTTYKLEENGPSEVGNVRYMRTRKAGENARSLGGEALVNDSVFERAFIRIKKGNTEVMENVPMQHIFLSSQAAPQTGHPIELTNIDWSRSEIFIPQGTTIVDGEVFEFTIVYDKLNLKK